MSEPVENFFDEIRDVVSQEMEAFGREVLDRRRAALSIPAREAVGSRGGHRYIASEEGEHPRARSGKLAASLKADSFHVGDTLQVSISTDHPGANRLEVDLNRPILGDIPDQEAENFLDRMATAVRS